MDDRTLVAALVDGDRRGLEGAYRRYADRLYTYCRGLLRDPDAAADAVHDTFVIASQRAGHLRDPDRFRSWLYAIARHECLRQLRRARRQTPVAQVPEPEPEPTGTGPETTLAAADLRELVRAASAGLNPPDREVLTLVVRHELPVEQVASVLGTSLAHAHARLSRARQQFARALGALLVARTGRSDCPDLAGLLDRWDGQLSVLVRKRVSRHVESCDICGERQRRQLQPAALFSAYAGLPFLAAPATLWPRLEQTATTSAMSVEESPIRFTGPDGFPAPPGRVRAVAGPALALGGVALALTLVLVLILAGTGQFPPSPDPEPPAGPPPATGPRLAPAVASPTGTSGSPPPDLPTTAAPTAETPGPASPAPTVATTVPPPPEPSPSTSGSGPLIVAADASVRCAADGRAVLTVVVVAGRPLDGAELVLQEGSAPPRRHAMAVDGTRASYHGQVTGPGIEWSAEVVAADGESATAGGHEVRPDRCPR